MPKNITRLIPLFPKTPYLCKMILSDKILTKFSASSTSFENLYSSHDSKCDYAKRPFRTFDANAKEKDYESGFHYYGSRYYSSEISTWLSTDPMSDKYPSLTPYNYCANNPVKLIDPNGEEIDPASKEKYVEPYKKELNARKEFINNLRGTDKWDDNYETQYNEYTKILTEIYSLEEDPNNIYKIQNGVNLGKDIQGEVSYGGKDGNKNVINISLASKHNNVNFMMESLAHELKHAYQFYEGRLGFVIDDDGKQITASNSKLLEQEAFTRGAMFSGNTILNNGKFRLDYDLNHSNYQLPDTDAYNRLLPITTEQEYRHKYKDKVIIYSHK